MREDIEVVFIQGCESMSKIFVYGIFVTSFVRWPNEG